MQITKNKTTMEQKYLDFTNECHRMAEELNKNYLSNSDFADIAVSVGIDWKVAKGWINGEVV